MGQLLGRYLVLEFHMVKGAESLGKWLAEHHHLVDREVLASGRSLQLGVLGEAAPAVAGEAFLLLRKFALP